MLSLDDLSLMFGMQISIKFTYFINFYFSIIFKYRYSSTGNKKCTRVPSTFTNKVLFTSTHKKYSSTVLEYKYSSTFPTLLVQVSVYPACHLLPLFAFSAASVGNCYSSTYPWSILLAWKSTSRLFHYIAVVELITPSTSMLYMYYHHLHIFGGSRIYAPTWVTWRRWN